MSSLTFGGTLSSPARTGRGPGQGTSAMAADCVKTRSKNRPRLSRVYCHASPWFGTNPIRIARVIGSSCALAYWKDPATGGTWGKAATSVR